MKKKLYLALGSITTLVPVSMIVACGHIVTPPDGDLQLFADLTSEKARESYANDWKIKVLKDKKGSDNQLLIREYDIAKLKDGKITSETEKVLSPNFDSLIVKQLTKKMLQRKVNKDGSFLPGLSSELEKSAAIKSSNRIPGLYNKTAKYDNMYARNVLQTIGMYEQYGVPSKFVMDLTSAESIKEDGFKLLISDDRLEFKTELLEKLISYNYLKTVDKEQWGKVNPTANNVLQSYESIADNKQFPLIREALSKRYFGNWKIKLNESASRDFWNTTFTPSEAIDNLNTDNNKDKKKFVGWVNYSGQEKSWNRNIFDFSSYYPATDIDYSKLLEYNGVLTQGSGPDNLAIGIDNYKAATDGNYYEGFIAKGDTKQFVKYDKTSKEKDITTIKTGGKENEIEFVKGIMPIYKNTKLTFDSEFDEVTQFFAGYDDDIYVEAKNYYLTKVEGGKDAIVLEWANNPEANYLKKTLEDKYSFEFFESKDPI